MIKFISDIWKNLRSDFWGTLALWQDRRPLWLLIAAAALFLEVFSWAFFQDFLRLSPCELCVYIRFSMLGISFGALLAAIWPKNIFFKLAGYVLVLYFIIRGVIWDITLEMENIRAAEALWPSSCSPSKASFPFGLPMDVWLPAHFAPTALCGEDSSWTFFGLNMAEWLFFVYAAFVTGVLCMLIAWIIKLVRRHSAIAE